MKINWGTGIVIAIVCFMSFILYFVVRAQTNPEFDNELVTEKYYQKEAFVEEDIARQKRANALDEKLKIEKTDEGIVIVFPSNFSVENIKGTVSFYRPSSQKLDFEIPISISNSRLLIPKKSLVSGLWDITVDWSYNNDTYLNKETIYF